MPGDGNVQAARAAAIALFRETGLPHRRMEAYKYTDIRAQFGDAAPLPTSREMSVDDAALDAALGALAGIDADRIVIVDGKVASNVAAIDGVHFLPISEALGDECFSRDHSDLAERTGNDAVVALNTALMAEGAALHIPGELTKPIHIVHVATSETASASVTRNVMHLGDGAQATILETFVTLGDAAHQGNGLARIGIGVGAQLTHIQAVLVNTGSLYLGNNVVDVSENARYEGFQYTSGAALNRTQTFLSFIGKNAEAHVNGAFLLRGKQHADATMVIDHAQPGCVSREFFKGVLDDEARGVFQGKVQVRQIAQKTDGKQMSQALLLSERAEFDAKPELEIFADDVACGHGATTGRIDDEHLFYLMARGVPEAEARTLLIQAFVGEVIETVPNEQIAEALGELAAEWMAAA
ncbi:MAG: Fe-S cluster assembly protein SufD [Pseudomonadota bacterium]